MLSRRNIRVKIMQILYAMNRDTTLELQDAMGIYQQNVDASYHLYLFHMFLFESFAKLSVEDHETRVNKHIPSEEDKKFSPFLYKNPIVQSLVCNSSLQDAYKGLSFDKKLDQDILRKVYTDYQESEIYKNLIEKAERTEKDYLDLCLDAYKFMAKHNFTEEYVDAIYSSWEDDKSLIIGTMKKTIKRLPDVDEFYQEYEPDAETTVNFGEKLLDYVIQESESLLSTISPILKNWDADRVAIIDMILIKMALSEMINFKTIPTKVTLNEFVELAKNYSTDKSKEFINGILDKLLQKLTSEGKIQKEGRGLIE